MSTQPPNSFGFLAPLFHPRFYQQSLVHIYDQWAERTNDRHLPWEVSYGGWGGKEYFKSHNDNPQPVWTIYDKVEVDHPLEVNKNPIIFLHGNGANADDWAPHAEYFLDNGYSPDELWAITFRHPTPTHEEMAEQIDSFVSNVRRYTGWATVDIVAHSLSVTGCRYWLEKRDRYEWVDTFVGIGGANHGLLADTVVSQPAVLPQRYRQILRFLERRDEVSAELTLNELNETETPGDIDYYTIRGQFDSLFVQNRQSPKLEGAVENICLDTDHRGIQSSQKTKKLLRNWLQE